MVEMELRYLVIVLFRNAAIGSTMPDRTPDRKALPFFSPFIFCGIEIIAPSGIFWIAIPNC